MGAISRVPDRSCVVVDPRHVWKLHAREPGDLGNVCCLTSGRTAGEGLGRTTRMYVAEESDSGIVPMNHSNKIEQSMAEGEEGRPLIEENTHQASTRPTQSGSGVSQGLAGMRKAAREHKEMKFTALLHHVTVDLLRGSFGSLKRKAAPGVDGMTWQEYETRLEDRLVDLHSRLHRGAYRALPSRRVYIEKGDGRKRPLGIAALEDKIVQHAVVTILNQIYEEDFLGFLYGFRPGRSQHQAQDALSYALVKRKVNYVLDADIQGFFDNLDKAWMIKFVEHRVADRRILRLIQKCELFSSWWLRVAAANFVSARELLCGFHSRHPDVPLPSSLDGCLDPGFLRAIAHFCRVPIRALQTLDLEQRLPHSQPISMFRRRHAPTAYPRPAAAADITEDLEATHHAAARESSPRHNRWSDPKRHP
jgi:Reverse transcriptase (RNA-dependent DNA polymerase)